MFQYAAYKQRTKNKRNKNKVIIKIQKWTYIWLFDKNLDVKSSCKISSISLFVWTNQWESPGGEKTFLTSFFANFNVVVISSKEEDSVTKKNDYSWLKINCETT